jgi:hypothetical protein
MNLYCIGVIGLGQRIADGWRRRRRSAGRSRQAAFDTAVAGSI